MENIPQSIDAINNMPGTVCSDMLKTAALEQLGYAPYMKSFFTTLIGHGITAEGYIACFLRAHCQIGSFLQLVNF